MWKIFNNTNLANNQDQPVIAYLTESDALRVNYPWPVKPYKAAENAALMRNEDFGYIAGQQPPEIATEVISGGDLTALTSSEKNRAWFKDLFVGSEGDVASHVIPIYGTLAGLVAHLNMEFDAIYGAESDVYENIVLGETTVAELEAICDTYADDIFEAIMATSNPTAGPVRLYPTAYIQQAWENLTASAWPGLSPITFDPLTVFPDELPGFPNP